MSNFIKQEPKRLERETKMKLYDWGFIHIFEYALVMLGRDVINRNGWKFKMIDRDNKIYKLWNYGN
ncbi:hypothetical protein LCGC14_0352050 [marine sediment metagenome]|uniref:Uncharacterized protein n=1 Tax=marine sediment metagenome TaxID=412755 RepID=A0A0F9VY50_9ZZZZ